MALRFYWTAEFEVPDIDFEELEKTNYNVCRVDITTMPAG